MIRKTAELIVAVLAVLIVAAVLAYQPAPKFPLHPEPRYVVAKDGRYLDYEAYSERGIWGLTVRWVANANEATKYAAWESANEDAEEWGGLAVAFEE